MGKHRLNLDRIALQTQIYIDDLDTYEFEFSLSCMAGQKLSQFAHHTYGKSLADLKKYKL